MKPISPNRSDRPWGFFDEFVSNTPCTVKIITVNPGESLSLQYHKNRSEFWVILSGSGFVTVGDTKTPAKEGDRFNVDINTNHRVEAGTKPVVFLEISTGHFDENDIVRLDDKYGRLST
ncbi:MAG: phosphomannose isomerase type II C-terminal cupin domain [Minisyncoccota bacterium]